eukprot:7081787-Prymnesium_polylepis.2
MNLVEPISQYRGTLRLALTYAATAPHPPSPRGARTRFSAPDTATRRIIGHRPPTRGGGQRTKYP